MQSDTAVGSKIHKVNTMIKISKIKLHNFKRFKDLTLDVDPKMNIFIGDNESGKSSILQAIDLVARGSRTRIEEIGLDRLFNVDSIAQFMSGARNLNDLPCMYSELYFTDQMDETLEGQNNSMHQVQCGIKMVCECNPAYSQQLHQLLQNPRATFPLEFFDVRFDTFAGVPYTAHNKILKSLSIDNSQIGSPYAMREYVREIYCSKLTDVQKVETKLKYHQTKVDFQNQVLSTFNVAPFSFAVRETSDDNIETDVTLVEGNVPIENKGTGLQCVIKTKLALNRATNVIDTVLIEEPENHLSYTRVLELIDEIKGNQDRQIFISTHSDLIATRLNLKKCFLLNSADSKIVALNMLTDETAEFFMKAPDNNMLQFILAPKTILVEGDAEFILMEALYKNTTHKELDKSGIGVIAVDGKCFKRYLEIAKVLGNKVAVITDNDKDFAENITNSYSDYTQGQYANIGIYSDTDNARYTFEVCIYKDNQAICEEEFASPHRRLPIQAYMLSNKSEAAYTLLKNRADAISVPQYIQNAITWIDA